MSRRRYAAVVLGAVEPPKPNCPRCGYDLGGTVASWQREGEGAYCPTEGTCSECGYALLWRNVLNPIYQRLPGFYEHARTRRERIAWGWRTTLWLIFPWFFWGKVKLHHTMRPLRALRLAAWMMVISLLMRATVAGLGIFLAPRVPGWMNSGPRGNPGFRPPWSEAVKSAWVFFDGCFGPRMVWKPSGTWSMTRPPVQSDMIRIMAPAEFLMLNVAPIAFSLAITAFIIWVLPDTSRRARLRKAHVWRAMAYAIVPLGIATLAISLYSCLRMAIRISEALGNGAPAWSRNLVLMVMTREWLLLIAFIWIVVFWWSAILRGWRLRHGWATCVLLAVGAGVAAALVSLLIFFALYKTEDFGYWIIQF